MKNLKEHFTSILDACKNCAEVGDTDDPISTGLGYEKDGIKVKLSFLASTCSTTDGDCPGFYVKVEEISGEYITNEDEDEIPDTDLEELAEYIEKELPSLLEE